MKKKEFNKENILTLIEEKRWQADFGMNNAKTKKEAGRYKGQIEVCDILKSNINAIWED